MFIRIYNRSCYAIEAAYLAMSLARLLNKSPKWPLTFIKLSDCILVQVSCKICSIIIVFGVLVYWRTFHGNALALFIPSIITWKSVNILIVEISIGKASKDVHIATSSALVNEGHRMEAHPNVILRSKLYFNIKYNLV